MVSESDDGRLSFAIEGELQGGSPSIELLFNSAEQVQQAYPLIQSLREIGGHGSVKVYTPAHPPDFELVGWPGTAHWPIIYLNKPSKLFNGKCAIRSYSGRHGDLGLMVREIEDTYRDLVNVYKSNRSE